MGGNEELSPSAEEAKASEPALTIHLRGTRFEGGRLPVSALQTLERMNSMVEAIARDLDVAGRDDAARASRYAKVELVLVGEIGSGSAFFKLLLIPLTLATSGPSQVAQVELLQSLPETIPAIVRAVHDGADLEYPLSEKTVRLVAEVGQRLAADEELVLGPAASSSFNEAVNVSTATVTLHSSNEARQAQDVSEANSFFVTGTIRHLENHGDEPGKLTLATSSGLYQVPSVDAPLVERAAQILATDRNAVLAISGSGVFDGKGRLKSLTHLTDMTTIDRHFNPERRLAELSGLTDSTLFAVRLARADSVIQAVALATGRAPGLFIDEQEQLEARWLIGRGDSPSHVVNVSFGGEIEVYVFDRSVGNVTYDETVGIDSLAAGQVIADVIKSTVEHVGG